MMSRLDPQFAALLSPRFQLAELERHASSIFGLWPDLRLAYVNPAWVAFANGNCGQPSIDQKWGLGSHYLDAIAEPLRPFYVGLLDSSPDPQQSRAPVSHVYECSNAELYRTFSMQVYALPERAGVIVVNSLVVETHHDPAERPPMGADRSVYVDARGVIIQCSHCRLVQRAADATQWDWVPAWVARSPNETSHGLCAVCFEYYYPDVAD
ncbi:hypothetical protein [Gemmatimonas sp.]|uniref:hypothetical protein n=1 Tax=Gemmatimonas sp. TaxID=1962908 RepID=UPI00286C5300|nr:hypothetical protein [Gemmatimonas sp.]